MGETFAGSRRVGLYERDTPPIILPCRAAIPDLRADCCRRARHRENTSTLALPNPPTLAALAADLGYFDQAHFARDFRAVVVAARLPIASG